ncbi:hypothetical protein QA942_29990 [Streptomyces sp. B21-106]|uniref:hypothetical protein n=1 Tax=Streptomyces sp. B21-106 TaxID=3039418 RepID=UPI002FEF6505
MAEPKHYVNAGLRDELAAKQGKTKLNVDKLIALLHELDDNYADGHAYSCHALLRAVIDHVPPILGHKSFEAAVNNYTWTRTDKKYMTRLLEFQDAGGRRTAPANPAQRDVITMHDLPHQAAALNALLWGCVSTGSSSFDDANVAGDWRCRPQRQSPAWKSSGAQSAKDLDG